MQSKTFSPDDTVTMLIEKFRADLGAHVGEFGIVVQFRVYDGASDRAIGHFAAARSATLRDRGCLEFALHCHAVDPHRFIALERWATIEDLDTHLRMPHTAKLREQLNQLIDGLPEFTILVRVMES